MEIKSELIVNTSNGFDIFEEDNEKQIKREIKVSTKIFFRSLASIVIYFTAVLILRNNIISHLLLMFFAIQIIMTFFMLVKNQYYLFYFEKKRLNTSAQSCNVLSHIYQVVYGETFEFTAYLLSYFVLLKMC